MFSLLSKTNYKNKLTTRNKLAAFKRTAQASIYEKYLFLLFYFVWLFSEYVKLKSKVTEYKADVGYWKSIHKKALKRESKLKKENEQLKAKVKLREQQLFGKKSETKKNPETKKSSAKKRGQQEGAKGHGRTNNSHLPAIPETVDLSKDKKVCPICELPYEELPTTEDSEIITITDVKAHKRVIRRKMYKKHCSCLGAKIITAPPIPKLIPKGKLDIPVWVKILIEKFDYQRPLNRLLKSFKDKGLYLAQGTVTDGLKKLKKFFTPVYNAIQNKCLEDKHWHADETRWSVFQKIKNKVGYRWWLWVFKSKQAVIFKIARTRSSEVAKEFFKKTTGILSVDRYIVYKVIAKAGLLILAFCWAHVRRDFLYHAKQYPKQSEWAFEWVELINELYRINNQRICHSQETKQFTELDTELRVKIQNMKQRCLNELNGSTYLQAKKLLESLKNHWDGLTVFVDYPEIPMDNNVAERQLRNSIVGRKNYYGSGSIWSSELAAMLFSIFDTLKIWKISTSGWLAYYLQACAENGDTPNIEPFLPWNMSEEQKEVINNWNTS